MNQLHKLIHQTIMDAIEAKTECRLTMKDHGVTLYSYQDLLAINCRLELYQENFSLIKETTGLQWIITPHNKQETESGSLFINWDKVSFARISQNNERVLIVIDSLEINFLQEIKK